MSAKVLAIGAHRHAWAVIDLLVRDERPMVRQRCWCGAEREIHAFERTWEPDAPTMNDAPKTL